MGRSMFNVRFVLSVLTIFPGPPLYLSVLWPGDDGAVAAGDGNDLDEPRDLRTVWARVSDRE